MLKKKSFSKILMMVMTFIMVFQMLSATAFAIESTDKGKITVNGVEDGVTVSSYQLMDVNYDYDVQQPKNPMYKWKTGVADWVNKNYPAYIDVNNENEVKEAFAESEDIDVAEFYDRLAVAIKEGTVNISKSTVEAEDTTVVIENLAMGNYFLIIEGGMKVYRPLTANVVPEWVDDAWQMSVPVVEAKSSEPSITKTVTSGLKADNEAIGKTVSFELNAVVPVYPENAKAKKYVVSDQLSAGLSFAEDSLKVYGMNSGKEPVILESGYTKTTQRPVDTEDKQVSFALDFDYSVINPYESLKITYDAVLNENAVVGKAGNGNIAYLDYSNNPYVENQFSTDGDETFVYTYGMKVAKVDEETNEGLSGAEFTLSKGKTDISFVGENGVYRVAKTTETGTTVLVSDENGMFRLDGLDAGTYHLTEVKSPDGYVKLQNPVEVVITDENMNGKVESVGEELADGYMSVTVKNDKGFTLPVTGGMGTTLFNIAGILLMGTGIVLIAVCYRRKRNQSL